MDKLIDKQQREQALNVDESFIVQAPAGSGKTELLIQRFLRLLTLVDEPEEIVAMTFTRKAAAEMQQRIINVLENVDLSRTPESEHAKQTHALAKAALQRANDNNWQLLEHMGRLRIQTIDAFSSSLTAQMPVVSGLGAAAETIEDASHLYDQAAINTLMEIEAGNEWSNHISALLRHLDNDMALAKRLIVNMLRKREQWLPHIVGIQSSSANEKKLLEKSIQSVIQQGLNGFLSILPEQHKQELFTFVSYAAKNIAETNPDSEFAQLINLKSLPSNGIEDLFYWKCISQLLLTEKHSWRKSLTVRNGFPPAKGNLEESTLAKDMKQGMLDLIKTLSQEGDLLDSLVFLRQLPDSEYTEQQWQKVNLLSKVLILADAQLRVIFANNNQIDFSGVSQAALQALGNSDEPTDLALVLDYNIKHLLVDEFQDISVNQYQLLSSIVRNWSLGDGHSLFLVGDPMQSIYRFREAEVGIFINTFHEQKIENIPINALRLKQNFRSDKNLVDYFNTCFENIFPTHDDVAKGAVSYSASHALENTSHESNVTVYPQYENNRDEEADSLIKAIQTIQKNKNLAQDSIAILVRSRTHLQAILPSLKEYDIAYKAVDIDLLAHIPVIRDLLALTFAYLYPADRLSWFSLLRAPWCGIELDDLQKIARQDKQAILFSQLNDKELLNRFSLKTRDKLDRILNSFSDAYKNQYRKSLRNTISSLWYDLQGPACYEDETTLDDVKDFFSLLSRYEEAGNLSDRELFIQALNKLYASTDSIKDVNPVQLMTIHKAKGLEFDHVLIPGLGYKTRSQQQELLLWRQISLGGNNGELLIAPIKQIGEDKSSIYQYLEYLEKESQSLEHERLLYVAMTRAKKSLHIFGHCNVNEDKKTGELVIKPAVNSHLQKLWPIIEKEYIDNLHSYKPKETEEVVFIDNKNYRLSENWQAPEYEKSVNVIEMESGSIESTVSLEYEWAGETIRQVGLVVHRLIQHISDNDKNSVSIDWVKERESFFTQQLLHRGVKEKDLDWAVKLVSKALCNIFEDERGQWILSEKHGEVKNEYALTGMFENKLTNIIIDRTYVDDNNIRWIIDYKTSRHEADDKEVFLDQEQERYRPQLEKYATIMQGIDSRPIRLGLYFPLLKGWREWDYLQ